MTTTKAVFIFAVVMSVAHAAVTWVNIAHDYMSPPFVETRR